MSDSTDHPSAESSGSNGSGSGGAEGAAARVARRGYLIGGGIVLAGLLVLAAVFLAPRGSGEATSPSATGSTTPSEGTSATPRPSATTTAATPSAAPSSTAEPSAGGSAAEAAPVIDSFEVKPVEAVCQDDRASTAPLDFSWASTGATQAWIGAGTTDASRQPIAEVGTSESGYAGIEFPCSQAEQTYTLTVRGSGGDTSLSITVTRVL